MFCGGEVDRIASVVCLCGIRGIGGGREENGARVVEWCEESTNSEMEL